MTQPSRSKTSAPSTGGVADGRGRLLREAIVGLAVALLAVRWFLPAEAAAEGDSLWIATAWCFAAALWWTMPATDRGPTAAWCWADVAVGLLIGGHLLGGAGVLVWGGQKRVAANLAAEWWSLALCWSILRNLVCLGERRRKVESVLLACAVATAGLGLYQHWVALPQSAAEFGPKIDQFRAAQAAGGGAQLAAELAREGIPTTEPALTLFEKRLRDSREPFGMFGLANTFGGFLAGALVLVAARAIRRWRAGEADAGGWREVVSGALIGLALLLTKSRTAWMGALCGGGAWLLTQTLPGTRFTRRALALAAVMIVGGGMVGGALIATGGWDWEVWAEAPKSLEFRLQYWRGAAALVREHPLSGSGLGQFRPQYLRVKLPEASEEIADPHNAVLDAWVNGGVWAAMGVLLIGLGALWTLRSSRLSPDAAAAHPRSAAQPAKSPNAWSLDGVDLGGLAAGPLAFGLTLASVGAWDDRLLALTVGWLAAYWVLAGSGTDSTDECRTDSAAALAATWVHLLGAGGLGMPAVVQWMMWLLAGAACRPPAAAPVSVGARARWGLVAAAALSGVVIATGVWLPSRAGVQGVFEADQQMSQQGWNAATARSYRRAAEADPWNPLPWERLAEGWFFDWRQRGRPAGDGGERLPEPLPEALAALDAARARDPANPRWSWRAGEILLALARESQSAAHAAAAAAHLRAAQALYPTNSELTAAWAEAAELSGDAATARLAARRAVDQDALNRRLGHVERFLPEAQRLRLENLASAAAPPASP